LEYRCGIDPNPHFSDEVHATLQLKDQNLIFQVEGNPLSGQEPPEPRTQVIKRGVDKLEYEFLSKGETFKLWEKGEKNPPDYLKLTLTLSQNKKEEYVFWMNKEPEGVKIR